MAIERFGAAAFPSCEEMQRGSGVPHMLRKYVEQILNLYNYIDGILIADASGKIEYYTNFRPDVNNLKETEVLGKQLLEVYPTLTEDTSSIYRVIRTGKPISNEVQVLTTYKGQHINAVNTTLPILQQGKVIGAVDVSRYIDSPYERQDIRIPLKSAGSVEGLYSIDDIITNSQRMKQIKERIRLIADTDSSVLIYGETGTGKELVAQSIHTAGSRKSGRFLSQNCAAIPETLLESILFGTTKGSYTGSENRAGLFEVANGGTLFLDEINSMEISMQTKLLKAIEEKQVTRIGSTTPIPIDVKIISAVNENPLTCIKEQRLREDLFYRLSVVQLSIPPLRERIHDLFYLTDYFIESYNQRMNRNIIGIDEGVEDIFRSYRWPGNVRELKHVIEGAFNVASSRFIQQKDLPEYLLKSLEEQAAGSCLSIGFKVMSDFGEPGFSLDQAVKDFEKSLIEMAMEGSLNLVEAADKLGISKQSLNYKLSKYKLERRSQGYPMG